MTEEDARRLIKDEEIREILDQVDAVPEPVSEKERKRLLERDMEERMREDALLDQSCEEDP